MQLKPNTELQSGKYQIIRVLGQGGFGITYLAENLLLGRKVAIKEFFPKDFCGRDNTSHLTLGTENNRETVSKLKDRFLKEARNIARLDHPGIIRIHDVFEENNTAYYVMDYIEGENLNEMVKRNGPLPEAKAIEYIIKVGEALEYIHSKNMTHFDVKPANIVVRKSDDMPILIDFGLSKQYDVQGEATSTLMQAVSQGYSAIELYNSGAIQEFSPQTDVYSLGATLYYLVTGNVPPHATTLIGGYLDFPIYISDKIKLIIKECLKIKKEERIENINDFSKLLEDSEVTIFNEIEGSIGDEDEDEDEDENEIPLAESYYEKGQFYSERKDYLTGFKYWLKSAELGHVPAIRSITLNIWDLKPQKYYEEILIYIQEQAESGSINAQFLLGSYYFYGMGLKKNYSLACKWLKKAADRGHKLAQNILGEIYLYGYGVNIDYKEALKWFNLAKEQNVGRAINHIADMYYKGIGVEKNFELAMQLYYSVNDFSLDYPLWDIFVESPYAYSRYMIGLMIYKGHTFDKRKDKRYARLKWVEACHHGSKNAQKKPYIRLLNFLLGS